MKKLLPLFLALVFMITIMPAQAVQKATVINPDTGHRKTVIVGDPHAFDDGYYLEIEYGVQRLSDDMMGYSVVSSYKTTLSASMTSTQSTVNVSSIKSKDGTTLTMGVLGAKVYLTIEPGGNKEEIVMATGISGSAWTGLTRGLAFTGTSTAAVSANKKTHSAGSTIIMSNVHYVYDELADKDSDETIGGAKTFSGTVDFSTVTPTVPVAAPTANDEIANKKYVDDIITAGAPDGTETTKGIWEGATRIEMASSTATGGTGAGLVLKSEYATSSPDVRGLNVIISENDGYIDQDWLDLTENFGFSGTNTHSGENTFSATTTLADITNGHTVSALIASTTITGATTPQPVYIGGDSGGVLLSDANDTDALDFTGFAITSAVANGTVYVQTDGIVAGFTGLTPTSKYYVQDAVGTIGTTAGDLSILVGIAISATELLILQEPSLTNGMTSYDMSTATGVQNIPHGLGKIPKKVELRAMTLDSSYYQDYSYVSYNGKTASGIYHFGDTGSVGSAATSNTLIVHGGNNVKYQTGTITFDATNIIISWVKTSTPTGNAAIAWEAEGQF